MMRNSIRDSARRLSILSLMNRQGRNWLHKAPPSSSLNDVSMEGEIFNGYVPVAR
jgi:hypothetical protein